MNRRIDFIQTHKTRKRIVGLLGGSFDPAHAGHLHICSYAKKRLGLKEVWFLPTGANPLKSGSSDFNKRLNSVRNLLSKKNISYRICDDSVIRGHAYSWQSIEYLQRRHRGIHFIWLMGADCWDEFYLWRRWRDIFRMLPIVIFPRHPIALRSVKNRVGIVMRKHRISAGQGRLLRHRFMGWVYFSMARNFLSSSLLRSDCDNKNGGL